MSEKFSDILPCLCFWIVFITLIILKAFFGFFVSISWFWMLSPLTFLILAFFLILILSSVL